MATKKDTFEQTLNSDKFQSRFREVLGVEAPGFINSLRSIYYSDKKLQECDPFSVVRAAQYAAELKLSLSPSLGYVYITPRKNNATFSIGYKGYIQLAHQTKQYTRIHAGVVRNGEIRGIDCVTGEVIRGEKISDEIVGYVAYMRLVNGFEKALYMTVEEVEAHAKKYSYGYSKGDSVWSTNFDAMAIKTVLKRLLNIYGTFDKNIVKAIQGDQAVIGEDTFTYVDNGNRVVPRDEGIFATDNAADNEPNVDEETGEVIPDNPSDTTPPVVADNPPYMA